MRRLVIAVCLLLGLASPAFAQQGGDATPQPPRQREILQERPSGFWTSNRPAEGGAYRWRLLLIGVGLAGVTGFVMVRLVRGASRARRQATASAAPRSDRR